MINESTQAECNNRKEDRAIQASSSVGICHIINQIAVLINIVAIKQCEHEGLYNYCETAMDSDTTILSRRQKLIPISFS